MAMAGMLRVATAGVMNGVLDRLLSASGRRPWKMPCGSSLALAISASCRCATSLACRFWRPCCPCRGRLVVQGA
jgi:hypothetical protein